MSKPNPKPFAGNVLCLTNWYFLKWVEFEWVEDQMSWLQSQQSKVCQIIDIAMPGTQGQGQGLAEPIDLPIWLVKFRVSKIHWETTLWKFGLVIFKDIVGKFWEVDPQLLNFDKPRAYAKKEDNPSLEFL